jgi:hypothetical protein
MSGMPDVHRAPMRSRSDGIDLQTTIDRARARSVCGFGRGGRNFQQTDDPTVGPETERIWNERL